MAAGSAPRMRDVTSVGPGGGRCLILDMPGGNQLGKPQTGQRTSASGHGMLGSVTRNEGLGALKSASWGRPGAQGGEERGIAADKDTLKSLLTVKSSLFVFTEHTGRLHSRP